MRRHALRFLLLFLLLSGAARAGEIRVAAAADLKFAMEEIVAAFRQAHPGDTVETVYGSSGKFHTQIRQGAPYDLYFSADIAYPRLLEKDGFAASAVKPYAFGRIVLWSASRDASKLTIAALAVPALRKIAIAYPRHAPYGKLAEEALRSACVWD
jgi:molybdate transport system substrate-binding protein